MSMTKKLVFALLFGVAFFSGSARKLLTIASNAIENKALAGDRESGASCG